jgi:hypothetical protein
MNATVERSAYVCCMYGCVQVLGVNGSRVAAYEVLERGEKWVMQR